MDEFAAIRAELSGYRYADYLRALPEVRKRSSGKPIRIAFPRSYTLEALAPLLELRLHLEGFAAEFFFGGYSQFVQEIVNSESELYRFQPDLVVLCTRVEELMPDFIESFGSSDQNWIAAMDAKASELAGLAGALREKSDAQVAIQNLCPPVDAYWGAYDVQLPESQSQCIASFNRTLAESLSGLAGVYVWDFEGFVRRIGFDQLYDPKMFYLSMNPFRQQSLPLVAEDLSRYLLSMLGKANKCIVLDLDNTLWGGIVGEDGFDGIELGHSYPGNCFRDFQTKLLSLWNRGVILAINSKNNAADALRVIDDHPYMVLRREHFAAMEINWSDKATNMRALASTLNIGLDSMIMLDDSPAECELLRQLVPECHVVNIPEQPYLIPGLVARLPLLENLRLTAEDRSKGKMYRQQAARHGLQASFSDVGEFLRSLDLRVTIDAATSFSIPRIAQLTQKTNQFNVTTRRYSETEIERLASEPATEVFAVSVCDRFGDNGIVGVIILNYESRECHIDTLLLSCRVIGREVETAMVSFLAGRAQHRGASTLVGRFVATPKNAPAADLYSRLGFEKVDESTFRADLETEQFEWPEFIGRADPDAD